MASMLLELRQAARRLLRSSGYSTSVVLTLALGIGAVATVFALIDGVLLRPLPYANAERLVLIRQQNLQTDWNTSVVDFRAIESQNKSFEAVAAMQSMDVILTGGPQPEWVDARRVTADFFAVMGVTPARGRAFHPGEDRPDAAPVVVLGKAFADRHFGPQVDPVGRTLTLDGIVHTIVGIMPPGVDRLPGMSADLWPAMRLAALLLELYRSLGPELPRLAEVAIDARTLAFVAVMVLANGLLFGAIPLLFTGAGMSTASHRGQATAAGRDKQLFRSGLVAVEFALALPLLIAAGLLINSLMQLQRVDPGFRTDHLLTARVSLLETSYPDELARVTFWERAMAELENLPGVRAAGLATGVPPDSPWSFNNFDLVGRPAAHGSQPMSPWTPVTPGFFEALGVRLLEGRGFDASDTPASAPVVLVSEAWAERWFPGETAVGKRLYEGGDRTTPVTIVGVTGDLKFAGLEQPGESVYAPIGQGWPNNPAYVYLRTAVEPLALAEPLRATFERLDPALAPTVVLASYLSRSLESLLFGIERTDLPTLIGACAVLLAVALAACWLPARRAARVDAVVALRSE